MANVRSTWRGAELIRRMREAMQEGVEEAAERVYQLSQVQVPRDTEQLAESGDIQPLDEGIGVRIIYGDDEVRHGNTQPASKYAIRQHEDLELNHPRGGKARYLADPTQEVGPDAMKEHLSERFRDTVGG